MYQMYESNVIAQGTGLLLLLKFEAYHLINSIRNWSLAFIGNNNSCVCKY